MAIEKGDKVRFLNDVGGGVVTRVIGNMAYVEDEDGFEIPAVISEIVLVDKKKGSLDKVPKESELKDQFGSSLQGTGNKQNEEPNIYLALLQGDKAGSQSGDFRLCIINDTSYHIYYSIAGYTKTENLCELMYHGEVLPTTSGLIDKIPGRLLDGKQLLVQILAFGKGKAYLPMDPVKKIIKIKTLALLRNGGFIPNCYFNEKAKLYSLLTDDIDLRSEDLLSGKKEETKITKNIADKSLSKTSRKPGEIIEIDLHIHELLDDVRGLSNSDMLRIQIDKFHSVIRENLNNKGQRIVFIHGVGNGVLKQEILRLLKSQYKQLYYQDASFKEYGYGATLIIC